MNKMNKIIDITDYLMKGKIYRNYKKAEKAVDSKHLDAIITFALRAIELDCEMGLGLGEFCSEKFLDVDTPLFDYIDKMYQEAAAGCYFCDSSVDPNAEKFDNKTPLCIMCRLKLTKIAEYTERNKNEHNKT